MAFYFHIGAARVLLMRIRCSEAVCEDAWLVFHDFQV
jgi:hypothetical protein